MIRAIYKRDYRGYKSTPKRRDSIDVKELKYSRKSDRNLIKKFLMEDFQSKCVYCGWQNAKYSETFFHIEHTKSKSENPDLVDNYQYMALACPVCNCAKNKKEPDFFIDPISPEFKELFYRNKFGAIVVNKLLSEEKKVVSKNYIEMIGLHKELYKLDYIYSSLEEIKACASSLEEKDYIFIYKITEILEFINKVARRKTNYFDF
ncbi:HNH endonuclease [Listeria monocytogenes]|uniref:HNH endonuclease n=1 Tax=Listeria monocytogenes TaxID=1639 RepID=UPI000E7310F3|nr:HNH endonuclease [Listeria monocytogenes]EAC5847197.1 HNH endonuclease [Listeria monocytogenes]EAG1208661.1 HNH endonuclease [Listeria monocytogenes]ECR7132572.1 HNH endonuclease [Listeria monocytogenes]EHG1755379.1 HNH endonuclease [Listeria monocytogenes]EHG1832603.1 HNH endonuclease [Listeria monocytogenes]